MERLSQNSSPVENRSRNRCESPLVERSRTPRESPVRVRKTQECPAPDSPNLGREKRKKSKSPARKITENVAEFRVPETPKQVAELKTALREFKVPLTENSNNNHNKDQKSNLKDQNAVSQESIPSIG